MSAASIDTKNTAAHMSLSVEEHETTQKAAQAAAITQQAKAAAASQEKKLPTWAPVASGVGVAAGLGAAIGGGVMLGKSAAKHSYTFAKAITTNATSAAFFVGGLVVLGLALIGGVASLLYKRHCNKVNAKQADARRQQAKQNEVAKEKPAQALTTDRTPEADTEKVVASEKPEVSAVGERRRVQPSPVASKDNNTRTSSMSSRSSSSGQFAEPPRYRSYHGSYSRDSSRDSRSNSSSRSFSSSRG